MIHDRRLPGKQLNLDHLVVAPAGVFVIDAESHEGDLRVQRTGLWRIGRRNLTVGSRIVSDLVAAMDWQKRAVEGAVDSDVPIHPVLCFTDAGWPAFASPFYFDGVLVTYPLGLRRHVREPGPLTSDDIIRIAKQICAALPLA